MKSLLIGVAGVALLGTLPAMAQTPPPQGEAPKVEFRTEVKTVRMPQTREQVAAHVRELFARFDTNHDGFITQQELAAVREKVEFRIRDRMNGDMANHANMPIMPDGPMPDRGAAFDRIDANHDGVITRDEFVNAQPQMIKREFRIVETHPAGFEGHGMMGHPRAAMLQHMFAMADANHDGRLSIDEATAAAMHHFDMADTNHDGQLSPDERMHAHQMMMNQPAN